MPSLRLLVSSVVALLLLCSYRQARAYPVLLQVDEGASRCFQFQIPEDDDAHLVAVILPGEDDLTDDKVEAWYFDQVFKLTKEKTTRSVIPRQFLDEAPDYVAQFKSDFFQKQPNKNISPIQVSLSNDPNNEPNQVQHVTKFFSPLVVSNIARITKQRSRRKNQGRLDENLGVYGICIQSRDQEDSLQFVMDIVLHSEEIEEDFEESGSKFTKEQHLTPLEKSLDQSIDAANAIMKEMVYLEQRERRMRHTADNINLRVHWFSYLSVSILLAVTYIQVTYLKRYFHKKKLM